MTPAQINPEMTSTLDHPAFSRTGVTAPFGKMDALVDAFKVEGVVLEEFDRRAAEMGLNRAEFLRLVMRVMVFGPDMLKSMHDWTIDRVGKKLGSLVR